MSSSEDNSTNLKYDRKKSRTDSMRYCKYSAKDHNKNEMEKQRWVDKENHFEHSELSEDESLNGVLSMSNGENLTLSKKHTVSEKNQLDLINESVEFQCGCKPQVIPFEKEDKWQVLLIGKLNDPEVFPIFSKIIKQFEGKNCTFYYEKHSLNKMKDQLINDNLKELSETIVEFLPINHEHIIDLIITLGGDGTILYTMSHFQNKTPPPIIAVEKGTLGFMCMYNIENIEQDFAKIFQNIKANKNLMVERKQRLKAVIKDSDGNISKQNGVEKIYIALNEIVVDRGQNASCLKMEILLNNESLTKTLGDGLIFSTPTGSTAYSLSAGGPIIQNEVRSISLVPICPFSLSFRPIVLPECSELRVRLTPDNRGQGKISGDGQKVYDLLPDEELYIETSDLDVYVVRETFKANNVHEWMVKLKKMLNWNSNFSK